MNLEEAIAGTLGNLDELEQQLVERQTELSTELADVEAALNRILAIREAAISGNRKRSSRRKQAATQSNREQVLEYLRTVDEAVSSTVIAEALERDARGMGPILVGLAKAGLVTKLEQPDDGLALYAITEKGGGQ